MRKQMYVYDPISQALQGKEVLDPDSPEFEDLNYILDHWKPIRVVEEGVEYDGELHDVWEFEV